MQLSVDIPYNNDISPYFGNGAGFNYFGGENKQHRFVIKSHSSVPVNKYIDVDWLQLDVVSKWNTTIDKIDASGTQTPSIFRTLFTSVTFTGNNSSYKYSTTKTFNTVPRIIM